ncbi:hypothetical protein XENORESO_007814 [Xenotaenia resolanae]|uniref:Uncharacterized protein n=1 Tax=Xenotaenia resolanae TaxID=208358 RepID=A0ABV0W2Q3_9TELE
MSTTGGRENVLRQVSQFWSMLDDLSENDPATYRKFIEEQMKRGAEFNAPPELHSCLRTQILVSFMAYQVCFIRMAPCITVTQSLYSFYYISFRLSFFVFF